MLNIKRLLLIPFVFTILLNANEKISDGIVLTSGEYISAKAHYYSEDYEISYNQFEKLFHKYSDNDYVNYYLGMSAVKLKKYNEATAAFERALIKNPNFHRARLEFAKVLYILGFKSQAKEELLVVLNSNDVPQNIKENIKIYLASLDDKTFSNIFAVFMIGWQYTDNVNNGLDDIEYTLPGFSNITVKGQEPMSENGHIEYVSLDLVKKLKNNPLTVKNKFVAYNKDFNDYNAADLVFYSYQPTLIYNDLENKAQYSLGISIDKVIPGENKNDKFMVYSITPKYSFKIFEEYILSPYLKYQKISYDKDVSQDRDFTRKELGTNFYYNKLYASLSYASDGKKEGSRTDINKNILQSNIGYIFSFDNDFALRTAYEYTNTRYDDSDTFFASKRKDNTHGVSIGVSKTFQKNNIINLRVSRLYNSSNQDAYDYDKDTVILSYIRKFQW